MVVQNNNINVLKYLMSIMIAMIHEGYSLEIPLLRAAVPVFFIISSYFFFKKIDRTNPNEQKQVWVSFIKRALKLYLFWFIVLLPITVVRRGWYQEDVLTVLWDLVHGFTLGSTFPVSWYISAYIIGISLIYKFRKCQLTVGVVSLCCYILCTISSNYYYLFDSQIFDFSWWGDIYNSFPVGLLFIYIGMKLAEKKKPTITIGVVGIIIGISLLCVENYLILKYSLRKADDCYFSLLILSPSVFVFFNSLPNIIRINTTYIKILLFTLFNDCCDRSHFWDIAKNSIICANINRGNYSFYSLTLLITYQAI